MMNLTRTKWIVIFFVGIIASLSLAAMHEDGSYNLNQFYDAGTVYNYQSQSYNISTDTLTYHLDNNRITVDAQEASVQYWMETEDYVWNYIVCNMKEVSSEPIIWDVEFMDESGNVTGRKEWRLTKGENILEPDGAKFKVLNIKIHQQAGSFYTIGSIHFRDRLSTFSGKSFVFWASIFMIFYCIIAVGIIFFIQKRQISLDLYQIVDTLQSGYIRIGNYGINCGLSKSNRRRCRVILFFLLFLSSIISVNMGWYVKAAYFKYMLLIGVIILLAVTFLSVEEPLEKKNWRSPLVGSWFVFWTMAVVSEFIVDKFFCHVGWVMLLAFPFYYFVMQNMKHPYQMVADFSRAAQWTFVVEVVVSFFCRPAIPGMRYCGIYKNPNILCFYLEVMLILFLTELDKRLMKNRKRGTIKYIVAIGLVLQQLWMTQSLTGFLMTASVFFFWFVRRRILHYSADIQKKSMYHPVYLFAAFCIAVAAVVLFGWGIRHVPQFLGTQIIYPRDDVFQQKLSFFTDTINVYAADRNSLMNSRIFQKIFQATSLDSLTTGRIGIYQQMIANMNLWGHYYRLNVAGHKFLAHNELLGMAFRYGVFAIIPYTMFLWYLLRAAVKKFFYSCKKNPYVFSILAMIVVALLKLMANQFEQPFRSMGWMTFYFWLGILFCKDEITGGNHA